MTETTEIKRLNYFTSQFLVAEDFQDEQKYHLRMRHLHNERLHGWGIVGDGLVVTRDSGGKWMKITPGLAIDSGGREIFLPKETDPTPRVLENTPTPWVTGWVTAEYDGEVRDQADKYAGNGLNEWKRLTERPKIELVFTEPKNGPVVVLAKVDFNPDKSVNKIDLSVRQPAGAVLKPDITARKLTVTDGLKFGDRIAELISLYDPYYAIGIQPATLYARSHGNFAWYKDGQHTGVALDPGEKGARLMSLTDQEVTQNQTDAQGNPVLKDGKPVQIVIPPGLTVEVAATIKKGLTVENGNVWLKGKVGIGRESTTQALEVEGTVQAKDLWVTGTATVKQSLTVAGAFPYDTKNRAVVDIAGEARGNPDSHPPPQLALYVTDEMGEDHHGVEFRHSNGNQGIGFGCNTIYATGADANQSLYLKARGTGRVAITQPAWTPVPAGDFKNGWRNFQSSTEGYAPAGYFKDSLGVVHLRGVVEVDSGPFKIDFFDGVIFTLPSDCCPQFRSAHTVFGSDGAAVFLVELGVDTKGQVIFAKGVPVSPPKGKIYYLPLDGVSFRAATG